MYVLAPTKRHPRHSFTEMTLCYLVKERNVNVFVRGWFVRGWLKNKFETKMVMDREDDEMVKKARVLNRIERWDPQ